MKLDGQGQNQGVLKSPQESPRVVRSPQEYSGILMIPQESIGVTRKSQETARVPWSPEESTGVPRREAMHKVNSRRHKVDKSN